MSYDGRHEFIEDFGYPDGVRIAVSFTYDCDAMLCGSFRGFADAVGAGRFSGVSESGG